MFSLVTGYTTITENQSGLKYFSEHDQGLWSLVSSILLLYVYNFVIVLSYKRFLEKLSFSDTYV